MMITDLLGAKAGAKYINGYSPQQISVQLHYKHWVWIHSLVSWTGQQHRQRDLSCFFFG